MQLSIFASQMRWTLADISTRVHRRVGTIRKLGAFRVRVKIAWLILRLLPVEFPLCFNASPAALDCLISSILQESAQSFCRAAWWPASHALLELVWHVERPRHAWPGADAEGDLQFEG